MKVPKSIPLDPSITNMTPEISIIGLLWTPAGWCVILFDCIPNSWTVVNVNILSWVTFLSQPSASDLSCATLLPSGQDWRGHQETTCTWVDDTSCVYPPVCAHFLWSAVVSRLTWFILCCIINFQLNSPISCDKSSNIFNSS